MHRWLMLSFMAALFLPCAWPQATSGTVGGTVRDSSGAVIAGADVVLTNAATGISVTNKTTSDGLYFFPGVSPGNYRVSVQFVGMEKFISSFPIQVAQSVIIDPVLKPGQITTTMDVAAVTPMVVLDSSPIEVGLDRERIQDLPINGRSLNTILAVMPGMLGSSSFGAAGGSRDILVDGMSQVDRQWDDPPWAGVGLDSVQEFTVDSYAVSAKLSVPTSIIVSTKGGANQIHGAAFETNRNSAIGVARARTDTFTTPPPLNRNEFGISGGGPVYIPKIYNGKNRTFWFFAYEGMKLRQSAIAGYTVPSAAERNGDFSQMKDSQGRLQVLYDPLSTTASGARTPFVGNVMPLSRLNPVSAYFFNMTPLPTTTDNNLVTSNWFGPQYAPDNRFQLSSRVDHRFSNKDSIYGVMNLGVDDRVYPAAGLLGGGGASGMEYDNHVAGWQYYRQPQKSISLTETHTFSPTFFNEFLVSVRYQSQRGYEGDGTGINSDVNWDVKLGLPNPYNSPKWPFIADTGLGSYDLETNDTKTNWMTYYILEDNATKVVGRHQVQFGLHFRRNILNSLAKQRYPQAQLDYGTLATSLMDPTSSLSNPQTVPQTGSNLANMFLGIAWYQNTYVKGMYYLRDGEYAGYIQDDFKVNSRLTLNLGLRYEYWPGFSEKNNIMLGFDLANHAIVTGADTSTFLAYNATTPYILNAYQALGVKFETYKQAGLPQQLLYTNKANLGPRLGFAYQLLPGKSPLVLRGAYSVSYFQEPLSGWNDNNMTDTPNQANFQYNPNNAALSPDGYSNYLLRTVPTIYSGVNSANVVDLTHPVGISPGSSISYYIDPHSRTPRLQGWNLTLERQLKESTIGRIRYIGSHQDHLAQSFDENPTTPTYIWYMTKGIQLPTGSLSNVATRYYDQTALGTVQAYEHTGYSNYNAVDFELERRFGHGLGGQLSYILPRQINATGGMTQPNQYMPGYVPTDYDARNSLLNYGLSTGQYKHQVKWNWVADLPFGRGKAIGGNANGLLQKLIGGWQVAGLGSLHSNYFALPSGNWNFTGEPIQVYGYKYPIQDCTSGNCYPGYLWTNAGYIPSDLINSHDASGKPNGYEGVPSNYKPTETPLIPWGSTAMPANAPAGTNVSSYWDTNTVWIPLKDGTVQRTTYNPGLNPWRNQYVEGGPIQWSLDASAFKAVRFGERLTARLNADFFNVLNHPGNPSGIASTGVLSVRSSGNAARILQLTLRLIW